MPFPRASRVKLVWGLELALGLELYACAVLALHARGLRATPLLASPGLVIPALVIPPVFYVLVGLVSVRPLSLWRVGTAAGAMCAVHTVLVIATGALFVIPDLVDYGAAVAFSLWGSPAVTMLQLTAAPLVLARLRPLLLAPRSTPRPEPRTAPAQRHAETSASAAPAAAREAVAPLPAPSAVGREKAAASPVAPRAAATAPSRPSKPVVVSPPVTQAVRASVEASSAASASRAPLVISAEATPFPLSDSPGTVARREAFPTPVEPTPLRIAPEPTPEPAEPMVRIPFSRIADQLPVEMFVRGREGLTAALRPGVSLLVPRRLLLPHLAEGVAPVKWGVVADQFPRDELLLTREEIESRLPDGSLRLPLDEVVPQIPTELLALSTPAIDVLNIEEFPPPFQPHVPPPSEKAAIAAEPELGTPEIEMPQAEAPEAEAAEAEAPEAEAPEAEALTAEALKAEALRAEALEAEAPRAEALKITALEAAVLEAAAALDSEAPEAEIPAIEVPTLETPKREASELGVVALEAPRLPGPSAVQDREPRIAPVAEPRRTAEARRIAMRLAPLMNGLAIGERDGAGMPLVTAVAPALSEDAVVATAVRVAPLLADGRLSEPVSQATLSSAETTIVLTPFGSPDGGALLVTAVASRASLAWLERLSRDATGEPSGTVPNGTRSPDGPQAADELRATVVPPSVRELAGSLTAFGPVTPTVLRDASGLFRVCLFVPGSLDALPLAELARDLYAALEGAEIGRVASVILRLGTYRLVTRAVEASSGQTTILVGGETWPVPGWRASSSIGRQRDSRHWDGAERCPSSTTRSGSSTSRSCTTAPASPGRPPTSSTSIAACLTPTGAA